MWSVYCLVDPIHSVAFYVGRTQQPLSDRLDEHVAHAFRQERHFWRIKENWILALDSAYGVLPDIQLVEAVEVDSVHERLSPDSRELYWIVRHLILRSPLTNRAFKGCELWGVETKVAAKVARSNLLAWAMGNQDYEFAGEIVRRWSAEYGRYIGT